MIALPFIFFLICFIRAKNRHGFDVYAYMLLLFLVISFFSIVFDGMDLYSSFDTPKKSLGVIAPFFYCALLSVCMYPYKQFNSNRIKRITGINERTYNIIVFVFFGVFLIILSASLFRIEEIISATNLASMRDDFYHGNDINVWSTYTGYTRIIMAVVSLWSGCGSIMLLFFFINIVCFKKSILFNVITLLGSTTPLILSLFIMDRSGFVHWFLLFGLLFVLFRKQLRKEDYKHFLILGIPLLAVMFLYFYAVTISRFGADTGGNTMDGVIYYAGQSYIYFCRFFNDFGSDAPFSLVELFPFTYDRLGLPSYFEQCQIVSKYCHYGVAAFSTFLGIILSMSGKSVLFLYVLFYFLLAFKITKRPHAESISFRKLIAFFIVALVIVNGLFGYCYLGFMSFVYILTWFFIGRIVSRNPTVY